MKKSKFIYAALISTCLLSSILFQNCATTIESSCTLDQFEGTYIGFYKVANLIDVSDTISITVDLEKNEATVTSEKLDTFFVTKYLTNKSELRIDPIIVPSFQVGDLLFTNVDIGGGFMKLDGSCFDLFVEMSSINANHNFTGLPNPLKNVKLDTPDFMVRQ